jgi:hypothetical protein
MPSRPSAAWERLGGSLVRRRLELDPRYRNRKLFAQERCPGLYRVLSDIELGRRSSYKPAVLLEIEGAYGLEPGSIDRFLAGGDLDASASEPATAPPPEVPEVIGVLATIGRNTPDEIGEMTALADKVQAVVAVARAFQPTVQLKGEKLFPRGTDHDRALARAWDVLNPMGLDDELQAVLASWNVISADTRVSPAGPGADR